MAGRKLAAQQGVLQIPMDLVFELAPIEMNRPEVLGDPLAVDAPTSLPKPSLMIEIVDPYGELKLEDRKLYNILLAESWGPLGRDEPGPFEASALALRRRIGQQSENSNRRIRDSLDRLMTTLVKFRKKMPDGQMGEAATTLLSYRAMAARTGVVQWDFHPSLRPYLVRPSRWARLNLDICARIHSKFALILYENLSLKKELNFPIWNVSVEELRVLFGIPADRYAFFSQFRQSVLDPALAQVNLLARFTAIMEVIDDPRTGKPMNVRFVISPERKMIA